MVIALTLFVAFESLPDLRRLWLPQGVLGYGTNLNGIVTAVDPHSQAAAAGMQPGDIIDVRGLSPTVAWYVIQQPLLPVTGDRVTFGLEHRGIHRTVTLIGTPEPMSGVDKAVLTGAIVLSIAIAALGAWLVLLRPSPVTWGLFLFCVGDPPIQPSLVYVLYPAQPLWPMIVECGVLVLGAAGLVGPLAVALRFLSDSSQRWRRVTYAALPYLTVALAALSIWEAFQTYVVGGAPAELLGRWRIAATWIVSLITLSVFVDSYLRSRGADRQRVQWVVFGFSASLIAAAFSQFAQIELTDLPPAAYTAIAMAGIIAPLTFAYAIIRYRVIDISFVVNRALVYGVLTTILVGVFSLVDWFFTSYTDLARLGTLAEVIAVVAFGLWFNGLHRRVDSFVDATFFRQRHAAERRLTKDAAALPFAPSLGTIGHFLVSEPSQALGLASAALFRRGADGVFRREESVGWSATDVSSLDDDDTPVMLVAQNENGPLSLFDHPWRSAGVPEGSAKPIVAMPIIVRRELAAIVFYGSHRYGEPLDPDEIRAISGLALGAAAAYDHLDAEAMKRENESLRQLLAVANVRSA